MTRGVPAWHPPNSTTHEVISLPSDSIELPLLIFSLNLRIFDR